MSRLPPFVRKSAATTVATATVATPATVSPDCSDNSGCSSSNPAAVGSNTTPTVASVAAIAVANTPDGFFNPAPASWDAADWQYMFYERAARGEINGGLSRAAAERQAFAHAVARWRGEHPPAPTEPGDGCAQCGLPMGDDAVAMLANGGHAWRHRGCWAAFDAARQAEAESAVSTLLCLPL